MTNQKNKYLAVWQTDRMKFPQNDVAPEIPCVASDEIVVVLLTFLMAKVVETVGSWAAPHFQVCQLFS